GRIGVGAMGTVYRARQVAMDRPVALKVLFENLVGDAEFVQRFLREARSAAKLNHPNIVHGYDAGPTGNTFYFAMEFVEGETVGDVLDREKRLDEARAVAIARSVALALDHAWQNHIVHRDVKPHNILLARDGTVKLADLGLARSVEWSDRITLDGHVLGTPAYMSPEQARGEDDIDTRSDLYSLGATLFHMVTGTTPFHGRTVQAIAIKQDKEPVPDPRSRFPGVSDAVARLIMWMMSKDRERRPQTPADLIGAIDIAFPPVAHSPGSTTLPIPAQARPIPSVSRGNRWLLPGLAGLAALLCLVLGSVLLLYRLREQATRPPDDKAMPSKTETDSSVLPAIPPEPNKPVGPLAPGEDEVRKKVHEVAEAKRKQQANARAREDEAGPGITGPPVRPRKEFVPAEKVKEPADAPAPEAPKDALFYDDFSAKDIFASGKWMATRDEDFKEAVTDTVDGRLRIRVGTIGTRDDTVKHLGIRSAEQVVDLSSPVEVAAEIDWNNQANGCYLHASLFLCPTKTAATAAKEQDWLKFEYVGVPPGKNARACLSRRKAGDLRLLYTEGWPDKQRSGRSIGKQSVRLRLDRDRIEIIENGKVLWGPEPHGCDFTPAYLYFDVCSLSNYPPRELFFDNLVVRPMPRSP
ncbi:MAG: serine/threonine protein kinase, partial [Planctomycetes bacterium]|nr:serine/threonine protein kinase [Planctomycetota bacterium]